MTYLGWVLAGICALGWLRARAWKPAAEGWEEAAESWRTAAHLAELDADSFRDLAVRAQASTTQALALAEDWKNAALLLNAALFQPLRGFPTPGKLQ